MALDLANLASVRAFATAFLSSEPRLDILIHNAGEGQQSLWGGGWRVARGSCPLQRKPCWGQWTHGKDAPYSHLIDRDAKAAELLLEQPLTSSLCPRDQFLWPDPRGV